MKRARGSRKRGRWLSEYVSREPCWNPHSVVETLNDLQFCEQLSPFPTTTQVNHWIHLQLILSEAFRLPQSAFILPSHHLHWSREGRQLFSSYLLKRPNKLRDHGSWLRAVFVCRCVFVCVREEKAWGMRRIHSTWVNEFCCDDIQKQDDPSWD